MYLRSANLHVFFSHVQAGGFKLPFIVFGGCIAILLLFQLVLVPSIGRHISINILPWSIICSGIAKLGHTGTALASRVCASPVQACLKVSAPNVPLSVANRELKIHKGVEIELHRIAICILRIMKSCMLPSSQCMQVWQK